MSLPALILLIITFISSLNARVTFRYSEVLQANDLVNNAATFICEKGCKVFVDRKDDFLQITQDGKVIANFNEIVGSNAAFPNGLVLPAAANYILSTQGFPIADFVFYVVSSKAPNFGVPVGVPQGTENITVNSGSRYLTVLSSANAVSYYAYSGKFRGTQQEGYPRIYTTGFDSVDDYSCLPVYQARTQYNAEQSRPAIFSPISTYDFGYTGAHSISAVQTDGKSPSISNVGTTVFMSPGYVGCVSVGKQMYHSNVDTISENFSLEASSLDIHDLYKDVTAEEQVVFHVNNDNIGFSGTSHSPNYYRYAAGTVTVTLLWKRATPTSSWLITNGPARVRHWNFRSPDNPIIRHDY